MGDSLAEEVHRTQDVAAIVGDADLPEGPYPKSQKDLGRNDDLGLLDVFPDGVGLGPLEARLRRRQRAELCFPQKEAEDPEARGRPPRKRQGHDLSAFEPRRLDLRQGGGLEVLTVLARRRENDEAMRLSRDHQKTALQVTWQPPDLKRTVVSLQLR